METLLAARAVSKTFATGGGRFAPLRRALFGDSSASSQPAVSDVSLELARGECLGIVGRNGAGKSTLLRILCGIIQPDTGQVFSRGKIAAMLELGAGFRPDFTGRENALINAALHGMDSRTATERLESIREFSEIGRYLERPVREYSSGMRARLAFSIAVHVDADILVVDEVLSVGDAQFQQKGRRFIREFLRKGAVIVVSHDDNLLLSACTRAAWMDNGRLIATGNPANVLLRYRAGITMGSDAPAPTPSCREVKASAATDHDRQYGGNPIRISEFRSDAPSHGLGAVHIDDVRFEDSDGRKLETFQGTDQVQLVIAGMATDDAESLIAGFVLRDEAGQNLFGDNSFETYRLAPRNLSAGDRFEARLRFRFPYLPQGTYLLAPSIISGTQADHVHQCWIEEAVVLDVETSPICHGKVGVVLHGSIDMK